MHIPIRYAHRDTGRTVQLHISHRPNTENVMSAPDSVACRDTDREAQRDEPPDLVLPQGHRSQTVQLHISHAPTQKM